MCYSVCGVRLIIGAHDGRPADGRAAQGEAPEAVSAILNDQPCMNARLRRCTRAKSYEGKLAALNAINSALQKENDKLRASQSGGDGDNEAGEARLVQEGCQSR